MTTADAPYGTVGSKFKEGAIVRALHSVDYGAYGTLTKGDTLTKGETYVVTSTDTKSVRVDNSNYLWADRHFELVNTSPSYVQPQTILGTQVGGTHYTDCAIQPIEYIWANKLGFSEGNIVKYITRWRTKGGLKDLEKAKHHIALLIEHETAKGTK